MATRVLRSASCGLFEWVPTLPVRVVVTWNADVIQAGPEHILYMLNDLSLRCSDRLDGMLVDEYILFHFATKRQAVSAVVSVNGAWQPYVFAYVIEV